MASDIVKWICILILLWSCNAGNKSEDAIPNIPIAVADLHVDKYEVGIGEFAQFVKETGYITTADFRRSGAAHQPIALDRAGIAEARIA